MEAGNLARIAGDFFGSVLLFREASDAQRPSVPAFRSHLLALLDAIAWALEMAGQPNER